MKTLFSILAAALVLTKEAKSDTEYLEFRGSVFTIIHDDLGVIAGSKLRKGDSVRYVFKIDRARPGIFRLGSVDTEMRENQSDSLSISFFYAELLSGRHFTANLNIPIQSMNMHGSMGTSEGVSVTTLTGGTLENMVTITLQNLFSDTYPKIGTSTYGSEIAMDMEKRTSQIISLLTLTYRGSGNPLTSASVLSTGRHPKGRKGRLFLKPGFAEFSSVSETKDALGRLLTD